MSQPPNPDEILLSLGKRLDPETVAKLRELIAKYGAIGLDRLAKVLTEWLEKHLNN